MLKHIFTCILITSLSACSVGPDYLKPIFTKDTPQAWHATLPHDGSIADLSHWWEQFNDPLLNTLITAAQKNSPTLDQALARVEQRRATVRENNAGLLPSLDSSASANRSKSGTGSLTTTQTTSIGQLDASWELDLFGGQRRAIESSKANLQSSQAEWHNARVTLAAEVADSYTTLRACENLVRLYQQQLESQQATAKLVALKVTAGFSAQSDGDLSAAGAAQTSSKLQSQKGICAINTNELVYLTGIDITSLENQITQNNGIVPKPADVKIEQVPAEVIEQRPDIAQSERALAAASADIGVAEADRYPSISLAGVIGINKPSGSSSLQTWSFGPTVTLPIFDAGKRKATADKSRAIYDEALGAYRQTVRLAVNEVEDALSRLQTVDLRAEDASKAVSLYKSYFNALQSGFDAGTSNLIDLEDARRSVYTAEETLTAVKQEQAQAWIALYKAIGGGWTKDFNIPAEKTETP